MESDDFRIAYDAERAELTLAGDLGDHALEELRNALEHHSGSFTRSLFVNLREVTYLPSVALGALVTGVRRAQQAGGRVELVAAPGTLAHRILAVTAIPHLGSRGTPTEPQPDR